MALGRVRVGSPEGTSGTPAQEFRDELLCSRKLPRSCGDAVFEVLQSEYRFGGLVQRRGPRAKQEKKQLPLSLSSFLTGL